MADLRDTLFLAAGEPAAELDLDRVLTRGAQRRRTTRVLQTTGALVPLAGVALAVALLGNGDGDVLGPTEGPVATAPSTGALRYDTGLTALPTAAGERVDYAYVRPVSAEGLLTYDKVEYDETACRALVATSAPAAPSFDAADEACFSNSNALERTVRITDDALVVVAGPDGRPQEVSREALAVLLSSTRPDRPLTRTTWRIVLRDEGERPVVVRMTELLVAGR
ncbi:MAG: hypothetical protein Q8R60_04210 [Mycobacteriales bacterium]|nr:hypothetical protein [Mycobacteriales bacterium]